MKTKTILFLLIGLISFSHNLYADSPLTSTDISAAYQNIPIVIKASKTDGVLTIDLMDYLIGENNPIELKMALINKLGWNRDGKNNSLIFFEYLKEKRSYSNNEDFIKRGNGDELLCMAYLKALDNYVDVDDAINYANSALEKNSKSYTYNIISAIIKAQKAMDSAWCEVYMLTNKVRLDNSLNSDMKLEAVTIIFEYMDLYEDNCN